MLYWLLALENRFIRGEEKMRIAIKNASNCIQFDSFKCCFGLILPSKLCSFRDSFSALFPLDFFNLRNLIL